MELRQRQSEPTHTLQRVQLQSKSSCWWPWKITDTPQPNNRATKLYSHSGILIQSSVQLSTDAPSFSHPLTKQRGDLQISMAAQFVGNWFLWKAAFFFFFFFRFNFSVACSWREENPPRRSLRRSRRFSRCAGDEVKKKKSGDKRERREEEGLTLTPSGFLFSRLLAAVEKEQEDGEIGKGEKKSVNGWNQDRERDNKYTSSTWQTSVRTKWESGELNSLTPMTPSESLKGKLKGVSCSFKKLISTNG